MEAWVPCGNTRECHMVVPEDAMWTQKWEDDMVFIGQLLTCQGKSTL